MRDKQKGAPRGRGTYGIAPGLFCLGPSTRLGERGPAGVSFELLFVNDGSRDDSAQKLSKLAKHHVEITVVELRRNFGQQIAALCRLSLASGASCVVMDADLQDPPTPLPLLWQARAPKWRRCLPGGVAAIRPLGVT
jgi:hypothetical protein